MKDNKVEGLFFHKYLDLTYLKLEIQVEYAAAGFLY